MRWEDDPAYQRARADAAAYDAARPEVLQDGESIRWSVDGAICRCAPPPGGAREAFDALATGRPTSAPCSCQKADAETAELIAMRLEWADELGLKSVMEADRAGQGEAYERGRAGAAYLDGYRAGMAYQPRTDPDAEEVRAMAYAWIMSPGRTAPLHPALVANLNAVAGEVARQTGDSLRCDAFPSQRLRERIEEAQIRWVDDFIRNVTKER